jgi:hypothetical protein
MGINQQINQVKKRGTFPGNINGARNQHQLCSKLCVHGLLSDLSSSLHSSNPPVQALHQLSLVDKLMMMILTASLERKEKRREDLLLKSRAAGPAAS